MRHEPNLKIEPYRIQRGKFGSSITDGNNGMFLVPRTNKPTLKVIAGDGAGWEHVSVTAGVNPPRTPTWEEMCFVRDLFWKDDETVIQFHPPKSANISDHDYCLHLWRQTGKDAELPPSWMIGLGIGHEAATQLLQELRKDLS